MNKARCRGQGYRSLAERKRITCLIKLMIERIDVLLQQPKMRRHLLVLLRILEAIAAVGRIHTFQIQIAASLTRGLAITFYLPTLALSTSMWRCYPLGCSAAVGFGVLLRVRRGLARSNTLKCMEHSSLSGHWNCRCHVDHGCQ